MFGVNEGGNNRTLVVTVLQRNNKALREIIKLMLQQKGLR
jgi:hypothetical protein